MTHFHGLWARFVEVVVLVRELLDHVQLVSFDIVLEHFRRGVAGDFHDVEDVHAGQIHERGSGTTGGVRHHELVLLDGFLLLDAADLRATNPRIGPAVSRKADLLTEQGFQRSAVSRKADLLTE